jgi:CRISPR-associated exonuclease Cas4
MIPIKNPRSQISEPREQLPLSLLNDFLYCPRRAALKLIEGWREANQHTILGNIVHDHADLPGYESQISNSKSQIIVWRALPVWSERLGLSGKCDIVEVDLHSPANLKSQISNLRSADALRPVEYKKGRRRQFENDDAQLCAQALCLEEMFGVAVEGGAVFHAESKRRREVEFTPELRAKTESAIAELHGLLREFEISNLKSEIPSLPPAVWKPACEECSLFEICLPRITSAADRAARVARALFHLRPKKENE